VALCVGALAVAAGCEPAPSPWKSDLVSVNAAGTQTGNKGSGSPVFSPDGTKVAFVSFASDLGPTDTNGASDVYVRDLTTGATTLVSTNAAGTQAANGASSSPVFSPDGARLAFETSASDLGGTDTNETSDIYVRDLSTGVTTLVSADESGDAGGAFSSPPVFSPDGTKIAFASDGVLLRDYEWSTDGGSWTDVFVRDLNAGTTTLVSVDVTGTKTGNEGSYAPVFSPDGSRIAFISRASDLGPTDTNGYEDLYVRDLGAGTTSLVTADASGTGAGNQSTIQGAPQFGPDGATLYFASPATNLVTTADANDADDVFARDLTAGTTTLVTTNEAGTASANGGSSLPILSRDGTRLAFLSRADDFGATDTNGFWDVYVRDLPAGTTTLVSAAANGDDSGNSRSRPLSFSPDGTRVAFASHATDLGPHDSDDTDFPEPTGDDTGNEDVYVRELASQTTTMVSTNEAGTDSANHSSSEAVFSPDGSRLAFVTRATDLGYTDRNESQTTGPLADVYVATFHGADLSVTMESDRAAVTAGGTVAYRVALANAGPDTSDATVVGVLLPEHSELVAVQATGWTCTSPDPATPNLLACDAGSLAPDGGADATITVKATAAGATLSAMALARSDTLDPNVTDNTARVDVTVLDEAP
jgi:uncharacterized repeat protein (TIGR01451 family)